MRVFVLALAIASVGMAAPSYGFQPGACPPGCNAASINYDQPSGLCLPGAIDGFDVTPMPAGKEGDAIRAYRNTLVVGHNKARNSLAITTYLFDRDSSSDQADATELTKTITEIVQYHPGAKLLASGKVSLPLAAVRVDGQGGFFTWTDNGAEVGSFLWLVPRGKRYLKIRASYLRPAQKPEQAMEYAKKAAQQVSAKICMLDTNRLR